MKDIKTTSLIDLMNRLKELDILRNEIDTEYNAIIYELCERFPSLKDEEEFKPKQLKKIKN